METNEFEITKDPYVDAQLAEKLRSRISQYAASAVQYGNVDRGWANTKLAQIGAIPLTGRSSYQINVPITGLYGRTIAANSRVEALTKFKEHIARVTRTGRITTAMDRYDSVYAVKFTPDQEPTFASGPVDPDLGDYPVLDLEGVKTAIRSMIMEGVAEQGWGHGYAAEALDDMHLEAMPALIHVMVEVPVTGVTTVGVTVFEGDNEIDIQAAVKASMARSGTVAVKPEEVGDGKQVSSGRAQDDSHPF